MKGSRDYFAPGDWNATCYVCGGKFKASELIKHWQGYHVCSECWEPRHPQDFVRGVADKPAAPWVQKENEVYLLQSQQVSEDQDECLEISPAVDEQLVVSIDQGVSVPCIHVNTGSAVGTATVVINNLGRLVDVVQIAGGSASVAATVNTTINNYNGASGPSAPVAGIEFTVQPSDVDEGESISPAVKVTMLGADGNAATGYTGNITISLGTNPGTGVLSGTLTQAAVAGVATFDDLSVSLEGTGYTLVATSDIEDLDTATSDAFDVTEPDGDLVLVKEFEFEGKKAAGGTVNRFPSGYDNTTFVAYNGLGSNSDGEYYRIDTYDGSIFRTDTIDDKVSNPRMLNEEGDIYIPTASTASEFRMYQLKPDGTLRYFTVSGGSSSTGSNGLIQGGNQTELVETVNGTTHYLGSINYAEHTADTTQITGTFSEVAKQNANLVGNRVYGGASGTTNAAGYVDLTQKTFVATAQREDLAAQQDTTCVLVGNDSNTYLRAGNTVYQCDPDDGSILGSIELDDVPTGNSIHLAYYSSDSFLWVSCPSTSGTLWWRIDVDTMTVERSGTLAKHSSGNAWQFAIGTGSPNVGGKYPLLALEVNDNLYLGRVRLAPDV